MAEFEYPLHAQQMVVFGSGARYRVVAAGRRWGKTHYGIARLLRGASERAGLPYWYVAPTLKQARDICWRDLLRRVPRNWLGRAPNESRLEVQVRGGSVLALRGADDPDSLRGRGLGGVVIDEYADIKPALWDEILQPSVLDTGGWADFLGTPKGFDHFYDVYRQGQDPATFPEWASWQFRTGDAPHIKPGELAAIRLAYEQRGQGRLYLQEFEASFESNAGYILGALWKPSHTVTVDDKQLRAAGLSVGRVIPWHVVEEPRWLPSSEALVFGSVDYGFGAPWSAHLHAALVGGHTRTFHEWYARETQDVDQARNMRGTIEYLMAQGMRRPEWMVLDPSMWATRRETGLAKSIAEVYEDELGIPLQIPMMPGSGGRAARLSRPQRWMAALSTAPDGLPWHSVTTACPHLIRTVPRVPWDKDDPEVEDDEAESHAYEDVGRFFEARPHFPIAKAVDPLAHLVHDPISLAHARVREKVIAAKRIGKRLHMKGFTPP